MSDLPTTITGVTFRTMSADEVSRICEIDVSEEGEVLLHQRGCTVVARRERWRRPVSYGEGWATRAEAIRGDLAAGGEAFGSFADDRLVGFACLLDRLRPKMAELTALWVSRPYRRRGVARELVLRCLERAERIGVDEVYASTMPSASAQEFYRTMGFAPTDSPPPECFEAEPEDIHMIKRL